MKNWISTNRKKIDQDLLGSPSRHLFTPLYYSQYKVTLNLIHTYITGDLIDLGCGDMPFRQDISGQVTSYDGIDLHPRSAKVRYVGDIMDMPMISDQQYDSAICLEVLEHLPSPEKALREINRILRPGGYLVISIPHISRLHDEPNDFFRFTKYGLEKMLIRNGFSLVAISKRGGLFSFLGHQLSTLVLCLLWNIPILKDIAFWLNGVFVTRPSYWIDQISDPSGIFAAGYCAVAQKAR